MTHPSRSRREEPGAICCSLCPPQQYLTSICNHQSWPVQRDTGFYYDRCEVRFYTFLSCCLELVTFFCLLLHLPFPFIFLCCSSKVFYVCAGSFLRVYKTTSYLQWHALLHTGTSTTNEKERKKDVRMSKHTPGNMLAGFPMWLLHDQREQLHHSAVHWATVAVTFTVTFRAKAIYFNDINTPRLKAAWTGWHFEACLDWRSHKSWV